MGVRVPRRAHAEEDHPLTQSSVVTQTIPGVDEATRLAVLRGYEVLDTPHEEAFDALVALAAEICQAPLAAINLIDADRQWFKAEQGFGIREMPLDHTVCGLTFLSPGLTVVADLRADNELPDICGRLLDAGERRRAAEKDEAQAKNELMAKLGPNLRAQASGYWINVAVTPAKPEAEITPEMVGKKLPGRKEARRYSVKPQEQQEKAA